MIKSRKFCDIDLFDTGFLKKYLGSLYRLNKREGKKEQFFKTRRSKPNVSTNSLVVSELFLF